MHIEEGCDLEQLGQQSTHRDLAGVAAQHRFAHRPQRLGEGIDVVVRRHIAGFEMQHRHAGVVAIQEAPQDLGQIAPLHGPKPS